MFILPAPGQPKVNKITNVLQKINPVTDTLAEKADLFEFFDIEPEEVQQIELCHKVGHGIEGQIYEFAALHYAY